MGIIVFSNFKISSIIFYRLEQISSSLTGVNLPQLDQLILNTYISSMTLVDWESWRSLNCLKLSMKNWGGKTMTTKRLLVVDDEACVQEVVQACFEEIAGWEVITANSGQEGLAKAIREQPDAIILDVMMPGMDGIGFLQRLKTDPSIKSIPVVLLTAKIDFTEPSCLVMLGIAGAIAKPFDPILLVEQVAESLGWKF